MWVSISEDGATASDLNQIGFLAGVGLDYNLTDSLYLRGSLLFQFRLASKAMDDYATYIKEMGADSASANPGLGPVIRLGIGYKF
jgi:opacity protein-like surface antigen